MQHRNNSESIMVSHTANVIRQIKHTIQEVTEYLLSSEWRHNQQVSHTL